MKLLEFFNSNVDFRLCLPVENSSDFRFRLFFGDFGLFSADLLGEKTFPDRNFLSPSSAKVSVLNFRDLVLLSVKENSVH